MNLDWTAPFKLAFEIGMFALGWTLVVIVVCFFAILTYAIVYSVVKTMKNGGKSTKTGKTGIITFDKK